MNTIATSTGLAVAAVSTAVIADQWSKSIARRSPENHRFETPLGTMRHVENRSSVGRPGLAIAAAVGGAALGVAWLGAGIALRSPKLVPIGAGLVAGGMASNIVDRARRGSVTDFIPTPVGHANIADAAIAAGIGLFALGLAVR